MARKTKWDLFISHASEDKEEIVKPLVKLLGDIGIEVWYDEFSLKLGDSLSRSLDKGLSNSRYGVVVISKSFMEKRWPEYELQALVTLERSGKRTRIIPIWHGIKQRDIIKFSPSLADKIAGDTSRLSLSEIAMNITEVVRPDIFDNIQRIIALQILQSKGKKVEVPLSNIRANGNIRHEKLPEYMIVRISIINSIFQDVYTMELGKAINNFQKDLRPDAELRVWERIAAIYLNIIEGKSLDLKQKKEVFEALLLHSFRPLTIEDFTKFHYLTHEMFIDACNKINI